MLFDHWYPVTQDFGLIQAPVRSVVTAFVQWHRSNGVEYSARSITKSAADAFDALLPLSNAKSRKLFTSCPSPTWTAFFQNGISGSDPMPAMSYLARQLGVLAMRVCVTPSGAVHPATIWEVYGPPHLGGIPPLGYVRSIACVSEDGRWSFDVSGKPFEFEDVEQYSNRTKRKRFSHELLKKYLHQFGLDPFAENFLAVSSEHPGIVLEQRDPPGQIPCFSLQDVKDGIPWRGDGARPN